ncbi:MAG: hypothetical protein KDD40_09105, partial [Bdellovibrionales bacterium]|nr:hypothetical protein [Bdellovibrionales bacterium]
HNNIATIDFVRLRLNACSHENLGDNIVFELLGLYADIPINYKNFADSTQFLTDFHKTAMQKEKDVQSFYMVFIRFLGNNIANFFKTKEEHLLDKYSEQDLLAILQQLNVLGINVQLKESDLQKAWNNLLQGNLGYVTTKAYNKLTSSNDLNNEMCGKQYETSAEYALKGGFSLQYLSQSEDLIASIVSATTSQAALNYEVGIGGTVTSAYLANTYGHRLVGSSVASYSVALKPSQLAIINGEINNWFVSDRQKGLAIIDNASGKLRVVNIDSFVVEDGSKKYTLQILKRFNDFKFFLYWVKKYNLDVFQSHLLVDKGANRIDKTWEQRNDKRRVLVTFENGEFGLIDFEAYISLHEAACLSLKVKGVVSVVNLDTGMYDIATFENQNGVLVEFGTPDSEKKDSATNKVVFFSK